MESLEHAARILWTARMLKLGGGGAGGERRLAPLTHEAVEHLMTLRARAQREKDA